MIPLNGASQYTKYFQQAPSQTVAWQSVSGNSVPKLMPAVPVRNAAFTVQQAMPLSSRSSLQPVRTDLLPLASPGSRSISPIQSRPMSPTQSGAISPIRSSRPLSPTQSAGANFVWPAVTGEGRPFSPGRQSDASRVFAFPTQSAGTMAFQPGSSCRTISPRASVEVSCRPISPRAPADATSVLASPTQSTAASPRVVSEEERCIAAELQLCEERLAAKTAAVQVYDKEIQVLGAQIEAFDARIEVFDTKIEVFDTRIEKMAKAAHVAAEKKAQQRKKDAWARAKDEVERREAKNKAERARLAAESADAAPSPANSLQSFSWKSVATDEGAASEKSLEATKKDRFSFAKVDEERVAAEIATRATEELMALYKKDKKKTDDETLPGESPSKVAEEKRVTADLKAAEERVLAHVAAQAKEQSAEAEKIASDFRMAAEAKARAAENILTAAEVKAEEERLATEAAVRAREERLAAEKQAGDERLARLQLKQRRSAYRLGYCDEPPMVEGEGERLAVEWAREERLATEAAAIAKEERISLEQIAVRESEAAEAAAREAEKKRMTAEVKVAEERLAAVAAAKAKVDRLFLQKNAEEERIAAQAASKEVKKKRVSEKKAWELSVEREKYCRQAASKMIDEKRIAQEKKAEQERLVSFLRANAEEERNMTAIMPSMQPVLPNFEKLLQSFIQEEQAQSGSKVQDAAEILDQERLAAEAAAQSCQDMLLEVENRASKMAAEAAARWKDEWEANDKKVEEEKLLAAQAAAKVIRKVRIGAEEKIEVERQATAATDASETALAMDRDEDDGDTRYSNMFPPYAVLTSGDDAAGRVPDWPSSTGASSMGLPYGIPSADDELAAMKGLANWSSAYGAPSRFLKCMGM